MLRDPGGARPQANLKSTYLYVSVNAKFIDEAIAGLT